MKLAAVYFDDTVCIPGGKDVGGGASRQDLRESSFSAADGWDLWLVGEDKFSVHREGMASVCIVGGYGYTYVVAEWPGSQEVAPPDPASVSPKERDMAAHADAGAPLAQSDGEPLGGVQPDRKSVPTAPSPTPKRRRK
jgi:hypothetical protein